MNFDQQWKAYIAATEEGLERYLPEQETLPPKLYEAMRYSVFAGGKRVRPVLLLASCEALGGKIEDAIAFACAMEMIHTYSLIHDDLPAMDNDDYRRGRLTNHKVYGEDMAILAGDGLLHHAFEVMSDALAKNPTAAKAYAMRTIAHGAGVYGMVAGQAADVYLEGTPLDQDTLNYIHLNKTAAMLRAAMESGAFLGGADAKTAACFGTAGEKMGLAFQIMDDVLDVTGTEETIGKPVFSDEKNEKTTYVTLFGVEKSIAIAKELSQAAIAQLKESGCGTEFLVKMIQNLACRTF